METCGKPPDSRLQPSSWPSAAGQASSPRVADIDSRLRARKHLPSLAAQFAGDRLDALATGNGFDVTETPEVLFICVRNSGRSQIAAGILRQLAGDRVKVRTAGSQPASSIDATIIDTLNEISVPIVSEFPTPLTEEVVQAADIFITTGCGDGCPICLGRRYLDWAVDDPYGKAPSEVRIICNDIQSRVKLLLGGLGMEATPHRPNGQET